MRKGRKYEGIGTLILVAGTITLVGAFQTESISLIPWATAAIVGGFVTFLVGRFL